MAARLPSPLINMPNLHLRLYAPITSLTAEGGELRRCAVADGYLIDELSVEDSSECERPSKAVVVFDESMQGSAGVLKYKPRWVEPDSGKIYSGTLRLNLPFSESISAFILAHPFHERPLLLAVSVEGHHDRQQTVYHIGPHDDGEYVWKSSLTLELPASIHWLTPDREFQQEVAAAKEQLAPPALQDEVLQRLAANLQAGVLAMEQTRKELKGIKLLVTVIAAGLFIYAVAKTI